MKLLQKIFTIMMLFAFNAATAGDSTPFLLDTLDPFIDKGADISLSYNSSWIGCDSSAEVVIAADGTEIKRTTGEGDFTWLPMTVGKHTLTYITYINGVAQENGYEVTIHVGWEYTEEDGKAMITKAIQTSGDVTVPSEIDGYPVVAIDNAVFMNCTNLRNVIISDNISSIGDNAFRGCENLESIILPEGLLSIGVSAFEGCEKLNGITIPSSVIEIDDRAFFGCVRLSNLTILETKDGIANSTRLGTRAFEDCDSLSTVLIPSRVSALGSGLFRNCENLQTVYYLGEYAPIIEGGATNIYQNTPTTLLTYVVPNSIGWLDVTLQLPVRWPDSLADGRGIRIMPEKKCKLTFVHNNGTDKQTEIQLVAGSLIGSGKLPELTRNGYSFEGWFTSLEGGALVSENSVVTANVILYAHWALLPVYKITFDCNGGTVSPTTREVVSGSEIGTLPTPTRSGYTFDGWFTAASGGEQISASTVVTGNITCYAHWIQNTPVPEPAPTPNPEPNPTPEPEPTPNPNPAPTPTPTPTPNPSPVPVTCTVSFNANGGSVSPTTRSVVKGSVIGALPTPTRSGYAFNGWYTATSGGTKVSTSTVVTGNVTYYAHWTENAPTPNPAPSPEPSPTPTPNPNPTPTPSPTPTPTPTPNPSPVPVTCTVSFNANGGSVSPTTRSVVKGSVIGALPTPTRSGYAFNGWYTAASGGSKIAATQIVSGNVTYYAHWVQTEYVNYELYPDPDVSVTMPTEMATVYDGYLYNDGGVVGTIQVKVSKQSRTETLSKATATIQIIGEKKRTIRGEVLVFINEKGFGYAFAEVLNDGSYVDLEFWGLYGMSGYFNDYVIDGARNLFSSKDKGEKADAENVLAPWIGALNMKCPEGVLSVTIAKKGKVTIKGTYNGAKVSAKTQALIGEDMICIPVMYSKKSVNLAFTVWLPIGGNKAEIIGLKDAVIGKAGTLVDGAEFDIEGDITELIPGAIKEIKGYDIVLPNGETVSVSGKKWVVAGGAKAAKIAYKKGIFTITEGKRGQGIANASGLKLTYKSKDGSFKGSFTVYAIEKNKLKKHKATVEGVLINGIGYGTATIKKIGTWAIEIK